jgi:hypothetical protein
VSTYPKLVVTVFNVAVDNDVRKPWLFRICHTVGLLEETIKLAFGSFKSVEKDPS